MNLIYISFGIEIFAVFGLYISECYIYRESFKQKYPYYSFRAEKMNKFFCSQGFISFKAQKYLKEKFKKEYDIEEKKGSRNWHRIELIICSISIPAILALMTPIFNKVNDLQVYFLFVIVFFLVVATTVVIGIMIGSCSKMIFTSKLKKIESFLSDFEKIEMKRTRNGCV